MIRYKIFKIIKIAVVAFLALVLFTFTVQWLWNALIPDLFQGPHLSFAQTLGLLVLSRILFGPWGQSQKNCGYNKKNYWRMKFKEKMAHLSPEERAKYQSFFQRSRWGNNWVTEEDNQDTFENGETCSK